MNGIDNSLIDELVEIIYQKIEDKFKKMLNNSNTEFSYNAYVSSRDKDSNLFTVIGQFGELTLPNSTGQDLSVNDKVKVYSDKGNMVGAYIGTKI